MMQKNPWQPPETEPSESEQITRYKRQGNRGRLWLFWAGFVLLLVTLKTIFPEVSITQPGALYTIILLFVVGSLVSYWSRSSFTRLFMMAAIWTVIISGVTVIYLYKEDAKTRFMAAAQPGRAISTSGDELVIARSTDGHFWIRTMVNDVEIMMMVDTGASHVVLSQEDAFDAGFDVDYLDYRGVARTANGRIRYARATADSISFGDVDFYNAPVTVTQSDMPGSLMGMTLLQRFASVEMKQDRLILKLTED